ncbi:hypothetical protein CEP52_017629 [Fusarium oligoseptatum]|uniref:Uncharacterized protein n=1 Tax=Fusarium oligoseptatum TaxID=2604345 RepID=A0A428RLQ1_9HYPO|nr:hypothetical protein CEP52_017629 [Fusarium oligoseptatum]
MSDEPIPVKTMSTLGFTLKRRFVEHAQNALTLAIKSQDPNRIAIALTISDHVLNAPSPTPDKLDQWLKVQEKFHKQVPQHWRDVNKWIYSNQGDE